jgi:hypothetical protein
MYNVERHAQVQALHTPTQHTSTNNAAAPIPQRRALSLHMICEALSWLGEMRALPFAGLDTGPRHAERQAR